MDFFKGLDIYKSLIQCNVCGGVCTLIYMFILVLRRLYLIL